MRIVRLSVGLMAWGALIGLAIWFSFSDPGTPADDLDRSGRPVSVTRYMLFPRRTVEVVDETGRVRRNDPVFLHDPDAVSEGMPASRLAEGWRQVGYVREVIERDSTRRLSIVWHGDSMDPRSCQFVLHRQGSGLNDVLSVMFPAEKRERIRQVLADAMAEHGEQLIAALRPLVEQTFRESLPIIEEEFQASLRRHRAELDQLAKRLEREVVSERLVPLAKREIMPIVRRHAQPPLEEIGRELWDRASLWRFGWRAAYDRSPLPNRNLVRDEWDRFIEEEAIPVFEAHMDDLVVAVERTLADVSANPSVRRELGEVMHRVANDPEATGMLRTILRETLVDNQRLRDRWREIWTDASAQQTLNEAGQRLEPTVRKIGDELFGTRAGGVDPDFARVLRSQILQKDRQWLVAIPPPPGSLKEGHPEATVRWAETPMVYPVVHLADPPGPKPSRAQEARELEAENTAASESER